ncbi:hypothetical protein B0H10DRAFT_1947168 [Mycena sp. CBHHK59/15]|nr:hypothetical protein B0H10DRAFT_1947168 [Mycena sp. CBHHK59/15]
MKKRALLRRLRSVLENYSPRPQADLPWDHQGHDLGIPIMNTGGKSRNDLVAGSWVQVCGGLVAEEAAIERSTSPQTPIRALHFDYRGYSGGIHYSPEGYIGPSTHSQPNVLVSDSDDEEGELQYPRTLLWMSAPQFCYLPGTMYVHSSYPYLLTHQNYPERRATYPNDGLSTLGSAWDPPYWRGHPAGLQGGPLCAGTPVGSQIQRFLDVTDYWSSIDVWTNPIPVFGRNKVIYIKTVGIDITPPDHFFELLR